MSKYLKNINEKNADRQKSQSQTKKSDLLKRERALFTLKNRVILDLMLKAFIVLWLFFGI